MILPEKESGDFMTTKLSISIVTFKTNHRDFINCLDSIAKSNLVPDVYIVDNSPDNGLEALSLEYKCIYIHNPENPGYGAGHNIAIKKSIERNFDFHLVLNADVSFSGDALERLVQFMNDNPTVGQVMPKVLNPDGSLQRLCKLVPSPADLILRRFVPKLFANRMRRKFELWDSGYDKTIFVPYLSGCFMLLRCDALKNIGIFDERFFMYPEDIDLTRRMAVKYDTVFYPHVSVIHEHGAASYKSLRMLLIHMFNIVKYFNKWGWFFDSGRRELNKKALRLNWKSENL